MPLASILTRITTGEIARSLCDDGVMRHLAKLLLLLPACTLPACFYTIENKIPACPQAATCACAPETNAQQPDVEETTPASKSKVVPMQVEDVDVAVIKF